MISALGSTTTCLGSYLFLVRARGVFFQSRKARNAFSILWLMMAIGVVSTTPFAFLATSVEPHGLCAVSHVSPAEAVVSIAVSIFDTAVFIAISYRAVTFHGSASISIKAFFRGLNAGPISRALLETGQLYFLLVALTVSHYQTLTSHFYDVLHSPMSILIICSMTFEFSSFIQETFLIQWRAASYLAIAVFYNVMACRVFRLLRLVVPSPGNSEPTLELSELHFRTISVSNRHDPCETGSSAV